VFGIATAFALTNVLFRLAWIRRRQMAILRCVGFGDIALVGYIFVQAATVTFFGVSLGVLGIFLLASTVQSDILGISI
jgi:ABC-type antimicrobial peptide transport system permease subunit